MALRENLLEEPISSLALRPLLSVKPTATVRQAIGAMRQAGLGCAMILDSAGRPVAMFTEKQLIKLLVDGRGQLDEPVSEHLTKQVVCLQHDEPIAKLIATMQRRNLRWVAVVDERGKATAITGLRGVIEYLVDHFPRHVKVQPIGSKLAMDQREGA